MTKKKYTITAALPYANGALHLGHLAGAYLPADIYARLLRLQGKDVAFICGSDEHGAAITIRAKKEGRSPQDIIDTYHNINKKAFEGLGISFDYYHRTSEKLHHETAQDFFKHLYEKGGEFDEKVSDQYYDEEYDQFLADRYIVGTCPKCGHDEAYGDQCEKCGSDLSPTELINPKSTLSGKTPVIKQTKHWYFKLDKHEEWLKEWIKEGKVDGQQLHNPDAWKNHVLGQCLSWVEGGLHPRAITRDLSWGIPVPVEGGEGKVLYVWFDAPIGYISSTKQWAKENNKNWEEYWKGDDVELVHFIGKDNIVFHCIVFPAMLKAHGDYVLPKNVPANQFLNLEGKKFSKSKGWVIEQHQYLEDFKDFPNKEDALRYALIRTLPENKDGDFKWDEFVALHDNELADNLGNFLNRVMALTNKYYGGKAPVFDANTVIQDADDRGDFLYKNACYWLECKVNELINHAERFEFKNAVNSLMEISSYGNKVFQANAPWKLFKTNPDAPEIAATLSTVLQIAATISVVAQPFIPFSTAKIRKMLNLPALQDNDLQELLTKLDNSEALIPAGHQLGEAEILFAKVHNKKDKSRLELIDAQKNQIEELRKKMELEALQPEPIRDQIVFDDFAKIDLRTGTIVAAEKVAKTKKLLKLTVDLGLEQRTVVSGIAAFYKPEETIGQQVVLVANLAPRNMRGIDSEGMILMSESLDGKLTFVQPKDNYGNGLIVK
ncbi:MAG: methionine--tRNA ligase [Aureispira sp.]|nr:methionine--tRNA ligase [Aureispira sp.]